MTLTAGVFRPGQPGYIAPGTDEWLQCITPSKVAAILGVSRWESPYSLWHRMNGSLPPSEPKDIYQVGHDYEASAANRWRSRNPGWTLSRGELQFVIPAEQFGFPVLATLDRRATRNKVQHCVEFKLARDLSDMEKWGDNFTGDCPEDYWTQVQAQMLFTGLTKRPGQLLALGPFWNEGLYTIPFDPPTGAYIVTKCLEFWESVQAGVEPDLDNTVPTYECVRSQHPGIVTASEAPIPEDLAAEYHEAVAAKKAAEERERFAKTRVLDLMGDSQFATTNGVKIARRQPSRGAVALYAVKPPKAQEEVA
ncbi:YqaJ viral recombinase family protein [Mycolicibacterium fluoranthenivorans]|uniref:Putative phage-related endonuclease n=1 Tax=Mycolicibacterium fluoranthenivorans TaxID=258505 RepID=A0A7X5U5Q2_9MYCO|nr:YqaJ viral recombinase family protein [Mycolicibacterium fluoranthenivorans]MCV7359168.1 YqaJ viral recombinase family protein [Mycolicibacterium fluoranthenivorans]NIH98945.1 putative phage-related endonuclease [Mycolicibacterium fluoranthenivorans]